MILAWMMACIHTLPDPLAEQRAALASLPPPGEGWAPQATLSVESGPLEQAITLSLEALLARGLAPSSTTMMGMTATMAPEAHVQAVHVRALPDCASCLQLEVALNGTAKATLANPTGSRSSALSWKGTLTGVLELSYDDERVMARPAAIDRWNATLSWGELPPFMNQIISGTFSETLRRQLVLSDLPPMPVVSLRGQTPVPVTAVRVHPANGGVALDFAFAIPTSGAVADDNSPVRGWRLTVPQETTLGLVQALALSQPYDPEAPATPEFTGLRLDNSNFELDIRAWPTRGGKRSHPRSLTVSGDLGLNAEGELFLKARDAAWLDDEGGAPDLVVLLFGDRLLKGVVDAMEGSQPGVSQKTAGELQVSARTTGATAQGGALHVTGDFEVAASKPTKPTAP